MVTEGKINHSLYNFAVRLGVSKPEALRPFYHAVRDREDIKAYRCDLSGMIILDNISAGNTSNYLEKDSETYFNVNHVTADDELRAETYRDLIRGKRWLDFGCGQGGLSQLLQGIAETAHAMELQPLARKNLNSKGIRCVSAFDELEDESYDLITMFHVFEHLSEPLGILEECFKKLKKGGRLILEVPHGNDALLSLYESEPFRKFTLWSEHLILHSRSSLEAFLKASSFAFQGIRGIQRYPVSNHLHWLAKKAPGGHHTWDFLNSPALVEAYAQALSSVDKTDTLVAYCYKT
jgi:2-polyprenyl-3-methyl-5-hydroxy-6-metoxy-1,4-benzoquinol methylase